MQIKICGLFQVEDIDYVNEAKPDYVGFVFAKSKRQVDIHQAEKLKNKLDTNIKAVGVFVEEGLLHPNRVQVAVCPPACLISGHLIGRQAEGDVLQYIHLGVQGGVGVLKDHLHILPKGLHILPRGMGHVVLLPAELHCTTVRPDAVKEQPRNRGFSAAGLTDDAQHLPLLQAEGNVIYC